MPRGNNLEDKALQLIMHAGDQGLLQSELWRKMKASSREGSRISIRLENKGLIYRERELSEGRWTYRVYSKRKPVSINSIITCPCLTCLESSRCEPWGAISPNDCEKLTQWSSESSEKEMDSSGGS